MKALRTIAIVAGVVALAATGVGALGSIGALSMSAATAATVATVASVATVVSAAASIGAQLMQKKPGAIGGVNTVQIGGNQPIPYGMGRCFTAGSMEHDAAWGGKVGKTRNPYLSKVMIFSASTALSIDTVLVDWNPISFSGNAATGYYSSWLYLDRQLGLRPEPSALAAPWSGMPDWSAAHKLSNYAAGLFSYRFDKDNKRWSNGIPVHGVVGRWSKVYDWREDSTFPGGSGAHRWDDEDTFAYDTNVALNAITYARGRFALDGDGNESVRIVGCGFGQAEIDWPAWTAFANICDANGWEVNGFIYDGPGISQWDNLKRICAAGAATPLWSGGQLSVRFQSPKVALDTITIEDFAEGEYISPGMRTWKDRVNTMVPKYRSEDNKWEYVQSTAISYDSYITLDDGDPKEEEFLCELVTDKNQAAKLTAYELFNRRELTGITRPCKPRLWHVRLGEAYQLVDAEDGLNHLVVVAAISKDIATATVTVTFETETTAKHALALGQTGTAPPPPTLIATGEGDDTAWAGDPPEPDAGDWTLSAGANSFPSLVVTGAAPVDTIDAVAFQYRVDGATEWTGGSIEPDTVTRKEITVPSDNTAYEVEIRYRIGTRISDPLVLGPATVNLSATTPDAPSGLSVTGGAGSATVAWTNPVSPNIFGVEILRTATNVFTGATTDTFQFGVSGAAQSLTYTLASTAAYWWVRTRTASGAYSTPDGPHFATVT